MPTSSLAPAPPAEIAFIEAGREERLLRVGPSQEGWVYRVGDGTECLRRIPTAEVPAKRRREIQGHAQQAPRQGFARLERVWQPDSDPGFVYIRYDVPGLRWTLAEALESGDARARARATRDLARAAGSWSAGPVPISLMPADVALSDSEGALLLGLPPTALTVSTVLQTSLRAVFLSPEAARGSRDFTTEDSVRYLLGAAVVLCCHAIRPTDDADRALCDAAAGVTFSQSRLTSSVPFWLRRMSVTQSLLGLAAGLLSPNIDTRRHVDLISLEGALERWSEMMDPLIAARSLVNRGTPDQAFALLQDTLLTEETYDLLLEAGHIAWRNLERSLEAADLFERAIKLDPSRSGAVEPQFLAITSVRRLQGYEALAGREGALGRQLDERVQRDWDRLDASSREALEIHLAEYLLWRGHYGDALSFIYPRLFFDGRYLWHKFEMNIAYAKALAGAGRLTDAEGQLGLVAKHLHDAFERGQSTAEEREVRLRTLAQCAFEISLKQSRATRGTA